jgi:uncharacterized protein (DUF2235 family)
VVRLAEVIDRERGNQLLFYDPGVGTLAEPGLAGKVAKKLSELAGLAFGAGLTRNVEEAYAFLMATWRPDDKVFLFGFSRGAYTVRVLAGLLHQVGLLEEGQTNLLPYLIRLFKAIRGKSDEQSSYWKLCNQFRRTFARPVPGVEQRRFPIHFMGLWDTVSSVGWVWDPKSYPFTRTNPSATIVRHVVSLDERRSFFRQNLFAIAADQDFHELWFSGVHADVGGGYPEDEGGLWREAFGWMVHEAIAAGLRVDQIGLDRVMNRTPPPAKAWLEPQHDSLTWYWWPAEFFPKLRYLPSLKWRLPALGLGRPRFVPPGSWLHESVLRRIREMSYVPPSLSPQLIQTIKQLPVVPPTLQVP